VVVNALPSTGHGADGSGTVLASTLLALAALLGIAATVAAQRARRGVR
jgi:hypothetical protein